MVTLAGTQALFTTIDVESDGAKDTPFISTQLI
jgi:hypothetical protein